MKSAPVVVVLLFLLAWHRGSCLSNRQLTLLEAGGETDEEEEEHDNQIKAPAIWLMCTTALPSPNAIVGSDKEVKMLKSEAGEKR